MSVNYVVVTNPSPVNSVAVILVTNPESGKQEQFTLAASANLQISQAVADHSPDLYQKVAENKLTVTTGALATTVTYGDTPSPVDLDAQVGSVDKLFLSGVFDPSANSAERPIDTGGYSLKRLSDVTKELIIPAGFRITRSWYEVITTFTSATDAATISLGNLVDDVAGIKAAIAISNGANAYDAGIVEGIQLGTAASFGELLTAARAVKATVAVEALTAGKLVAHFECSRVR